MLYAPSADGGLSGREFAPPTPTADTWEVWERAAELAGAFWRRASELESLSIPVREIALRNSRLLAQDRVPSLHAKRRSTSR